MPYTTLPASQAIDSGKDTFGPNVAPNHTDETVMSNLHLLRTARLLDPTQTGHDAEKLERNLLRRVVGQDEAVDHVVKAYQTYLAGMACPWRAIGNFLFL